jgi:hypothetical protein
MKDNEISHFEAPDIDDAKVVAYTKNGYVM